MVLKESTRRRQIGKRRLVVFATQALCAFFLFYFLYGALNFKGTPSSQQIKFDILVPEGRQILSDWKQHDDHHHVINSNAVKKDDDHHNHNQSLQDLLATLLRDEDRTKLDSTGLACESSEKYIICVTNKPVKIDMRTLKLHRQPPPPPPNTTTTTTTDVVIRPYAMQEHTYAMESVTPVTITTTEPPQPTCDHNHQHPAVIFSTGGYTGNMFHELNENIIPLFITTRHFRSRVHFITVDYKPSFIKKYRRVFSRLTDHELIDPAVDSTVHCFPAAITGLKFHNYVAINTSDNPQGYTMPDFREFLRRTYKLKARSVSDLPNPPSLLLISRQITRKFLNLPEMVKMMEELGFRVIVASSNEELSNVDKLSRVLNSCSVMVGMHGAGLSNAVFLPDGGVMIQVRPLGFQWGNDSFYSEPVLAMGLKYLDYRMEPKESSLADEYGLDHPVVADTASVGAKGGYSAVRAMYLDKQNVRINLNRFRGTLIEALGLVGRHTNISNRSIV